MVTIEFLGPIDHPIMELDVASLDELAHVLSEIQTLQQWLPSCAVAVNDTLVNSRDVLLSAGDKVSLLPPVCGG